MKKRISISLLLSKSRSYFFRLFVYISISIITLISITAYSITNSYTDKFLETVNSTNQKLLSNNAYNFDYINNYISSLIYTLYDDNSVKMLIYSKNPDVLSINSSFENLNNSLNNLPFIKSVYIYSGASDNYYCISDYPVVRSSGTMYDGEIVDIINNHTVKVAKPIPRIISTSAYEPHQKVKVYSYVLFNADNSTGKTSDAIIVNVDTKWLTESVISKGKFKEANSTVTITNNSGLVYAQANEEMFMSNLSKSEYFRQVMLEKDPSGYFVKDVEGIRSVVTYIRLEASDLVFISVTPLKELYTHISEVIRLTIVISIVLLLVSLIIAYLISKKFYIPVYNLKNNMYSLIGLKNNETEKTDEFSVMNSMFTKAAQKINALESFTHDNIHVLKNQFLVHLLTSGTTSIEESIYKLEQLGIQINPTKLMVLVVFHQDRDIPFNNNQNKNETDNIEVQFINIALAAFEKVNFSGEVVKTSPGCFIAILNFDEDFTSYDEMIDSLTFSIEIIQNDIMYRAKKSYSVSISRIFRNISNMSQIYTEAFELTQYKFVEGTGCILTSEYINEIRSENLVFPHKQANELIEAIKNKKLETAIQIHNNISAYLSEFSLENIRYGLLYLSIMVFDMINAIENNSNITFEIQHSQFSKRITSSETLLEINNIFEDLYTHIIDKLHLKKNPKTDTLIEDIKVYIEAHYTDLNLSLLSIADKFGYSPAYLGKIFNTASGTSLASYINEVRLNKASTLLKETKYTIEEILQNIGWESKKYFFTVFKKRFGVTPNEYRFQ